MLQSNRYSYIILFFLVLGLVHGSPNLRPRNMTGLGAPSCECYVRIDGVNSGSCGSYAAGCNTIHRAMDQCDNDATICVYPGTYYITSQIEVSYQYLYGVEGAENTIIDGSSSTRCIYLWEKSSFDLDGFTIQNCYSSDGDGGGGIRFRCLSAITYYPNIRNCIIQNNRASTGGGMYNGMCCPTLNNVIFRNNQATSSGGGFFCDMNAAYNHPAVSFTDVRFVDNYGSGPKNIDDETPGQGGTYSCKVNGDRLYDCGDCYNGGNCQPDGQCVCLPGSSLPSPGCDFCSAGSYSTASNAASCTQCGQGMYQDQSAQTFCHSCGIGTYNENMGASSANDCLPCVKGSYNGNQAQSVCLNCGTGMYTDNEGSTTIGECLECDIGTYQNKATGSIDDCLPCVKGSYNENKAQSVCLDCGTGMYTDNEGSTKIGDCLECSAGTFQNKTTGSIDDCLPCAKGMYNENSGQSICLECPTGTYNNKIGSTTIDDCLPCGKGTYNELEGQYECVKCGNGTYNENEGSTTIGDCLACSTGTYQNQEGADSIDDCLPCGKGRYNEKEGQYECLECPTGTYNENEGSTTIGNCLACSTGTYQNQEGAESIDDCLPCGEGLYNENTAQSICLECPTGTYNPTTGVSTKDGCLKCKQGTYNEKEGQAECDNCGYGSYNAKTGSNTELDCRKCRTGTYNDQLAIGECLKCGVGTYNPFFGSTTIDACLDCPAGEYNQNEGQGICLKCDRGSYNEETKSTYCIKCPKGTSNPIKGANSSDLCISCLPGNYSDQSGSSTCKRCDAGLYNDQPRQSACQQCAIGTYTNGTAATTCLECNYGTYANSLGSSECLPCSEGSYSDTKGAESCTLCSLGTFNPNKGSKSSANCEKCEIGTFSDQEGQSQCQLCTQGNYLNTEGGTICKICFPGSFSSKMGATTCSYCNSGSYQDQYGQSQCNYCPLDTYENNAGSTNCKSCPLYSTTLNIGTKLLEECFCTVDFYGEPGENCARCPEGGVCNTFNQKSPISGDGYWNSEENPNEIIKCAVPNACPGGEVGVCNSELGYTGVECSECLYGFYKYQGYCEVCPENNWIRLFLAAVLFAVCTICLLFVAQKGKNYFGSFSIVISFFQVVAIIPGMDLKWPDRLLTAFKFFSVFNFNIELLALECTVNLNYPTKWFLIMLMPLFAVILFIVIYILIKIHAKMVSYTGPFVLNYLPRLCARPSSRESIRIFKPLSSIRFFLMKFWINGYSKGNLKAFKNTCINSFIAFLFIMFLMLCLKVLDFFDCTKITDSNWTLDADPDYRCFTDWWFQMLPFVIVFGLLYIVGIPLFLIWMLWYHTRKVDEKVFEQRLGLLCNRYKKDFFYWELIVMARKIFIVLFQIYLTKYPKIQITLCNLVLLCAIIFQAECNPYNTTPRNALEFSLLCVTQFILLAGMIFVAEDFSNSASGTEEKLANAVIAMMFIGIGILGIVASYEFRDRVRYKKERQKIRRQNKYRDKIDVLQEEPVIKFLKKKPNSLKLIKFVSTYNNKTQLSVVKFHFFLKEFIQLEKNENNEKKKKFDEWETKKMQTHLLLQKVWSKDVVLSLARWYQNKATLVWKIRIANMLDQFIEYIINPSQHHKTFKSHRSFNKKKNTSVLKTQKRGFSLKKKIRNKTIKLNKNEKSSSETDNDSQIEIPKF
ncbi:hypothetical protein M0813_06854 [Anaeramoeba flamelloides]|uniref:Tyrosine-protein kinase ephrin type A/B receptor-like domain-containing protein n=1 Tax=Anaeramoeba flamelloides TaxID=1746091 RepID=A0ABQ8XC21_9EUKA|nr:hypothetical protein M0813_06854 [Anaeramoeba flamelloides]